MIWELAEFESKTELVRTREADISHDGFGNEPRVSWQGEAVGFAIFFNHYSTWTGTGLCLEDLFVRGEFRRRGIGKALVSAVARMATQETRTFLRACSRLKSGSHKRMKLGADLLDEWRTVSIAGENLKKLT